MKFPTAAEYNVLIRDRERSTFTTLSSWNWWTVGGSLTDFILHQGKGAIICKAAFGNQVYALKLFTADAWVKERHYKRVIEQLKEIPLAWTSVIDVLSREIKAEGKDLPVILYPWVDGVTLDKFVDEHLADNRQLSALQRQLIVLSRNLEKHQLVHGDLQPGNLLVHTNTDGTISLTPVDYDTLTVTAKETPIIQLTEGIMQHPRVLSMKRSFAVDRFPIWCMMCALEALKWDKSLWNAPQEKGYNTAGNLLFGDSDIRSFDQSMLIRQLYSMNIETLNFYLYGLNRFVHSLSNYVEEPELHGEEILSVEDIAYFATRDLREPETSFIKDNKQDAETVSGTIDKDFDCDDPLNELISLTIETDLQSSLPPRIKEHQIGKSAAAFAKVAFVLAALTFVAISIFRLSTSTSLDPPVSINKLDSAVPADEVKKPVISKYSAANAASPEINSQRVSDSLNELVSNDSIKADPPISFVDTTEIRQTPPAAAPLIVTNDAVGGIDTSVSEVDSLLMDKASAKRDVILTFFDLIRTKRTDDAWELVNEGAFKNSTKTWFKSEKGYGYIWEVETDEIDLQTFGKDWVDFRVKYYAFHIYDGPKCFDQRIRLQRMPGNDDWWVINSMKNVIPPVKCAKR